MENCGCQKTKNRIKTRTEVKIGSQVKTMKGKKVIENKNRKNKPARNTQLKKSQN